MTSVSITESMLHAAFASYITTQKIILFLFFLFSTNHYLWLETWYSVNSAVSLVPFPKPKPKHDKLLVLKARTQTSKTCENKAPKLWRMSVRKLKARNKCRLMTTLGYSKTLKKLFSLMIRNPVVYFNKTIISFTSTVRC